MGLLAWLKKHGIYEVKRLPQKKKKKQDGVLARRPTKDELAIGFAAYGEGGARLQGVLQADRATHMYVVGASGTGKTRFLETLILQDIRNGNGFGVVDAHSDLTEELKGYLVLEKISQKKDDDFLHEGVVLIDPADPDSTVCFNPLERAYGMDTDMVVGELVAIFKKIWADAWGNRMQDLLTNTLIALVENDMTLAELPMFLRDFKFRKAVLERTNRPYCREYFDNFNSLSPHTQHEWSESTLNKIGQLLNNDKVRQIFISPHSSFSFRDVMDKKKILLVKLDRGRLKGSADLLGSLILAKLQMTAFARTDLLRTERVPFYLYVDEFQNFAEESFKDVLEQSRKYKLPLVLAHQQLAQLPAQLRASVLTNCGLQAYFRVSRADADILAKESYASVYHNPPGWEHYIQELQELPTRVFAFKRKGGGDVPLLLVQELHDPHAESGGIIGSEKVFNAFVQTMQIGKKYLRSRNEIEAAYEKRRSALFSREEADSFKEKKL